MVCRQREVREMSITEEVRPQEPSTVTFTCERCKSVTIDPDYDQIGTFGQAWLINAEIRHLCKDCTSNLRDIMDAYIDGDCTIRFVNQDGSTYDWEPCKVVTT
jgi:hypothetical protein